MQSNKLFALLLSAATLTTPLWADEGIWLFNQFPKDRVKAKYGFEVTDQFLDHLRLSSVRLSAGGSASIVSADGLLFTNHHVASECIQQLSSKENDYMKNGFYASRREDEKRCPDMEANILLKIEDVTSKIRGEGGPDQSGPETLRKVRGNMAAVEKECNAATGNRCDVVTLFAGEIYHLYQYKKYTDVRLVFAPEAGIAMFGGDPDNFTYPRFCLDASFLRVYEDGKPIKPLHYLKWSRSGAKEGELAFVSGHPGTTGRLATVSELEFFRDTSYPLILDYVGRIVQRMLQYSRESEVNRRIAADDLFSQQNSFKAYTGFLSGLRDPALMGLKRDEEATLRAFVDADPELKKEMGATWDEIAEAHRKFVPFYQPYFLLERNPARVSSTFQFARTLLRMAEEKKKPNGERLREFTETALPARIQSLEADAPVHASLEMLAIETYLEVLEKHLGATDPLVAKLLAGRSPREAASAYVSGTKLADVAFRKKLMADTEALESSKDPMLEFVRAIDPEARRLRKRYEDEVESVLLTSASRIGKIRFAKFGANEYPDATFTLRLSYGAVRGYESADGKRIPWATNFDGLYARATGQEPFRIPERWLAAKNRLNRKTPFNFVSTADTHGGNSGSPTVNRNGEVTGILFDGNIEGLPNRFVYRDLRERSVHVASQGITEALRKVYQAQPLLRELGVISK